MTGWTDELTTAVEIELCFENKKEAEREQAIIDILLAYRDRQIKQKLDRISYGMIVKWAKEAKAELKKGNLDAVKTNLSIICSQAAEEVARK
jgi:KaiC/GvpD/RAD55 family RecA-like ATPase